MKRSNLIALSALIITLSMTPDTFSTTKTSTQSGNWSAAATWGGNPPPAIGDDVIIHGGFTISVDIPNATCLSLQLGGSVLGAGTGTLSFTNGSQLTVFGAVSIGPVNNNNTAGSLSMTSGGTLVCEGLNVGRLGTWTAGTGTVELTATNTLPSDNNVIFNNLTISGGTTTVPRNVDVNGNIVINTGAALNGGANTLTVAGNWTNNGSFTGNTGTVTFIRNGNQTIAGSGLNNFNLIRVNMGVSISNTLEVLSTNFSAPDGFLTLVNGTFKVSGSFAFASTFIGGPTYNISPTSGLWINNPNVTVTAQAGPVSVRGLLRLSAGTYNVGMTADTSLVYQGSGSTIIIEGGALHIAGRFTPNNATATTSYTQSGGTVTVVEQGSTDPAFGGFDLGAVGSVFTMSGGTIVVRNATSASADYVNAASVASVTGGTLQIGDASSANGQTIRIQSARPVGNLLVSNATAQVLTSSLNVTGSITIQPGRVLDAGGLNITLGGDWSNGGAIANANTVTFNGSGAQTLTAGGTGAGKIFNGLTINKISGTLTLNGSATVSNALSLTQGTLSVGGNTLTLNANVTGGGTITSANNGTVSYNQSSAGQNVLAGNYGNLTFSAFNKALPSIGTIGISGTFSPGAAVGHVVTGSSIEFNGASQNVPVFTYNNLTLSGSGTKTGSGTLTVSGNLTNNPGIVFSSSSTLNLNGLAHTNGGTLNAATLSIGTGATLTNNGTTTSTTELAGEGTLIQASTGVLNIGGIVTLTTLNSSASGNAVNYSGIGQTIAPVTYYHLTLSGSGVPILTAVNTINGNLILSGAVTAVATTGISVGGNFTIGSGSSFSAGAFSHSLAGNWDNSGLFNGGTSTFTLNGTGAQSMNGSSFYNLVINNASGVSILSDETITNSLTLTNGAFSIGAHTLALDGALSIGGGSLLGGPSSNLVVGGSNVSTTLPGITLNNLTLNRANGDSLAGDATINGALTILSGTLRTGPSAVILGTSGVLSETAGQTVSGNVRTTRTVTTTSGTEVFGNIGADIVLNGVSPGVTTVVRKTGVASTGNGHASIKRYFDITPTNNSGLNVGLVFHYDDTEINGQAPNTLELYRSHDNGTTWNNLGGVVNITAKIVTIAGINDFSRWTVSDTSNRIGNTPPPTTVSISPAAKTIGDPGFTITVHGTDFVNVKSTVRFNGNTRTTTYVNATQLTASIPASDLVIAGTYPVAVFTVDGGGLSNTQPFVVNPLPPTKVRVETAADGSGTLVQPQNLASGLTISVYAITRDTLNNFVANVAATSWTLENITGGIVAGDLTPAVDGRSAVLAGHVIGTADIRVTSGALAVTPSGTITITSGVSDKVRVETSSNGSGTIVPAQSIVSGLSIVVFAIARDASNNFVTNVAADTWSLQNTTGGIVPGDLVPSVDSRSAVFTGHAAGTASIHAASGTLTATNSGLLTVTLGSVTANVSISSGWNLISNPVTNPIPGDSVRQVYPTSLNAYAFEFSGGYLHSFRLQNGKGYWAKFPSAITNFITGTSRTLDSVNVVAGWNIIGSISDTVDTNTIVSVPPGLRLSKWFGYSSGYIAVASLIPGNGYWVKSSAAGKFVLASPMFGRYPKAQVHYESTLNDLNTLTITDSRGASQTLYFGADTGGSEEAEAYVMPPLPPAGAFDARFETSDGGTMVQTHPTFSGMKVTIQSDAYPLTITWRVSDGVTAYELADGNGGQLFVAKQMGGEGKVTITNPDIHSLSIKPLANKQVPAQFGLWMNYPNPFNPATQITFDLPSTEEVSLIVYDMVGREIVELAHGSLLAGSHTVTWDASGYASGVYFARLNVTDGHGLVKFSKVNKLILMK